MDSTNLDDYTLPDDAWKDSFDKLLDQRPILRELNVIKRDIRASFNLNSSYENSSCENTNTISRIVNERDERTNLPVSEFPKIQHLEVPKVNLGKKVKKACLNLDIVSTPVKTTLAADPFKCTLSPIGPWKLMNFEKADKLKNTRKTSDKVPFNSTSVNGNALIEIVEDVLPSDRISQLQSRCSISPLTMVRNKWKSKQKHVLFATNTPNDKSINIIEKEVGNVMQLSATHEVPLQPGKWRKSLHLLRRTQNRQLENVANPKISRTTGDAQNAKSSITTAASVAGKRKSIVLRPNLTIRNGSRSTYSLGSNDFKRQLLQRCGQRRVLLFEQAYNEEYLKNCCKIGEGAFGEVFLYSKAKSQNKNDGMDKTVLKIIPIEGKELVNGEVQKTFEQILPEVIISMELCALNDNRKTNVTSGYINLQRVRCVKGEYPAYLKKLWEEYDLKKESENDHPECFTNSQHYIVLELAFGGQDLEGFAFKNAEQSYYVLQQIILTLAVGENEYQFEHRDLHWGNVLIVNTDQQYISYKLAGEVLTTPTKGVQATIIDYTLSRLNLNDYCFYNDLSNDEELFTATGDYQFDIYRMMRDVLNHKWEVFEPKTNIFWISYIITKMLDGVSYKNVRSKLHLQYIKKLEKLQTTILTYKSCIDCTRDIFRTGK